MSLAEASLPPENRPAPLEALLLEETPVDVHYRRNHFGYPTVEADGWRLEVCGAVERPLRLGLDDLRSLPYRKRTVLLECAGHRRVEYDPPVPGVRWELGALSEARWGGTSLSQVLRQAQILPEAMEVVLYGADAGGFAGLEGTFAFARSLPLGKAFERDTLLAWEMNGGDLPREHGAPLRAVVSGWYAMDSVKWLQRIEVVDAPFRGPFQELDYRIQRENEPGPGRRLADTPVHSIFIAPEKEAQLRAGWHLIEGIAWGGFGGVALVEWRLDDGPWQRAELTGAPGPYQRAVWRSGCRLEAGEHLLSVRATDGAGDRQPERAEWNRRGYANNGVHRVRVLVI